MTDLSEKTNMKILCVGYFHGAGGAEKQIIKLSNELSARGHSVTLIALAKCNVRFKVAENVVLVNLSAAELDGVVTRFRKFKKFIKDSKPDLIINYWFQSAYFSVAIPKKYRGKVIYSERGDPGDKEYSGLLGFVRKIAFKKIDGFVFQSKGARDYFNKKVIEKSTIIPNSVSIPHDLLYKTTTRDKRIVSVGRLHPQKNQRLLINAFAKIAKDFPEYVLEIYGDGELRDELQMQVVDVGLRDRISFIPSCNDVFNRIKEAALFVLTSDYEGMPNALMEAMALGLPCVATDCSPGGARELIQSNVNGIIVPVNDEIKLAKTMKYMLSNPEIAEQMAIKATEITETHSDRRIFDAWENFCNTLLSKQ